MKTTTPRRPAVYTLTIANLALVASTAFAFMIGNLPPDRLDPRSCQITLSKEGKKQKDGSLLIPQIKCSGTIIGKSRLTSAAHCFEGEKFVEGEVQCPGDTPKKITSWTYPKDFHQSTTEKQGPEQTKFDIAVVRIEGDFKTSPARLPKGPSDMQKIYDKTTEGLATNCGLFGYGENEKFEAGDHNGRSVLFEEWTVGTTHWTEKDGQGRITKEWDERILRWWQESSLSLIFRAQDFDWEKNLTNAVRHGDSGGGLLCYDDLDKDRKDPVLMGITSGNGVREDAGGYEAHVAVVTSVAHRLDLLKDLFDKKAENTVTAVPVAPVTESVARNREVPTFKTHYVVEQVRAY